MTTDRNMTLNLEYPMFVDQIEPKGHLTLDKRTHACWYYLMLATKNFMSVGRGPVDQIIETEEGLETPLWMDKEYERIARTVALLYGLESPDEFLRTMPVALKEAIRLDIAIAADVLQPFGVKGGVMH